MGTHNEHETIRLPTLDPAWLILLDHKLARLLKHVAAPFPNERSDTAKRSLLIVGLNGQVVMGVSEFDGNPLGPAFDHSEDRCLSAVLPHALA